MTISSVRKTTVNVWWSNNDCSHVDEIDIANSAIAGKTLELNELNGFSEVISVNKWQRESNLLDQALENNLAAKRFNSQCKSSDRVYCLLYRVDRSFSTVSLTQSGFTVQNPRNIWSISATMAYFGKSWKRIIAFGEFVSLQNKTQMDCFIVSASMSNMYSLFAIHLTIQILLHANIRRIWILSDILNRTQTTDAFV